MASGCDFGSNIHNGGDSKHPHPPGVLMPEADDVGADCEAARHETIEPIRLCMRLQSMLDCCQNRILEGLDSRFLECEKRFVEKVREQIEVFTLPLATPLQSNKQASATPTLFHNPPEVASSPGVGLISDVASIKQVEGAMRKHAEATDSCGTALAGTWAGIVKQKIKERPRRPTLAFCHTKSTPAMPLMPSTREKEITGISSVPTGFSRLGDVPVVPGDTTTAQASEALFAKYEPAGTAIEAHKKVDSIRKRNTQRFSMLGSVVAGVFGHMSVENTSSTTRTDRRWGRRSVFVDADMLRLQIRDDLLKPQYDVCEMYKDTGFCQRISRSVEFEYCTQAIIFVNSIWMAFDIDYNHSTVLTRAHPVFLIGENIFCLYFTCEWFCRFLSFRSKPDAVRDFWFCLDFILLALMIFETWILTLVYAFITVGDNRSGVGNASILKMCRLMRLTRMARLAKLLQAMPELMTIVKGIFVAARTVFLVLCLVTCTVYVFAIGFRQITVDSDIGDEYFSSVPHSMSSLLLGANLPDVQHFVETVGRSNFFFGILLMIFICVCTITLFNMLTGVLVEVVTVTAAVEREQMAIIYVKNMMERAFLSADIGTSGDSEIHVDDFAKLLAHPDAHTALTSVGVDVVGLLDFTDFIFTGEMLTFSDFVEVILRLRGTNKATVKDVVDLRLFLTAEIQQIKVALQESRGTRPVR